MNAPTNVQILNDAKGKPAFAVIPYSEYLSLSRQRAATIPNAVVNKVINKDMTPIRAWREHLGLTQTEVARRLGVSQSAISRAGDRAEESLARYRRGASHMMQTLSAQR